MSSITGGVRLRQMIEDGKLNAPFLWIDTYNQSTKAGIVGTIKARIDANCMYFITTPPMTT